MRLLYAYTADDNKNNKIRVNKQYRDDYYTIIICVRQKSNGSCEPTTILLFKYNILYNNITDFYYYYYYYDYYDYCVIIIIISTSGRGERVELGVVWLIVAGEPHESHMRRVRERRTKNPSRPRRHLYADRGNCAPHRISLSPPTFLGGRGSRGGATVRRHRSEGVVRVCVCSAVGGWVRWGGARRS